MLGTPKAILPKAILFDMDGTLTRPNLDFDAIRADVGVVGPILEAIDLLSADQQQIAHKKLLFHERLGAQTSELNDGCVELLRWVESVGIRTALVTRNTPESVETILRKFGLNFDVRITRDDKPYKPQPEPAWLACSRLGIDPTHAWFVGDGCHDIECAVAADIASVWISHGQPCSFDARPTVTVRDLLELHELLRQFAHAPTVDDVAVST